MKPVLQQKIVQGYGSRRTLRKQLGQIRYPFFVERFGFADNRDVGVRTGQDRVGVALE